MRPVFLRAACVSTTLAVLLAGIGPCLAPSIAIAQSAAIAQAAPKALFINILEGEGELNDVRARTAREPIVQVEDENHKPVAGVLVLFAIDTNGGKPLANFSGSRTLSVRTGSNGQATAQGFQVTSKTGNLRILVHAVAGSAVADAVISQTNFSKGNRVTRSVSQHKGLVGGVIAIGAVAAVVLLQTRSSGTTITAGNGTIR